MTENKSVAPGVNYQQLKQSVEILQGNDSHLRITPKEGNLYQPHFN